MKTIKSLLVLAVLAVCFAGFAVADIYWAQSPCNDYFITFGGTGDAYCSGQGLCDFGIPLFTSAEAWSRFCLEDVALEADYLGTTGTFGTLHSHAEANPWSFQGTTQIPPPYDEYVDCTTRIYFGGGIGDCMDTGR